MPGYFSVKKADREHRRDDKAAAKRERRAERRMRPGSERFDSAFPDAPEDVAGDGRTLSRGMP